MDLCAVFEFARHRVGAHDRLWMNGRLTNPVIVLIAMFSASPATSAESSDNCSKETYDAVARHLGLETFADSVVSEACKSWPHKGNFLLAAFAFDQGIQYEKSLWVALLDRKTLRPVSTYKSVIAEDAVTEVGQSSLRLDTARFQLSPDVRAFGLRFGSTARGPSCGEGASWDELTLFVREQKQLRPVFKMDMQFQNALKGCIGSATGNDIWKYGRKTISVANTTTNGFADLLITETVTVDGNTVIPKSIKTKRQVSRYLAKYNGKEYEIPSLQR
jgi:hypothetical protein